MLIDDFLEKEIVFNRELSIFGIKIKDAVVFSVNETCLNFHPTDIMVGDNNGKPYISTVSGKISQKLPFNNIVINFTDGIEWAVSTEYDTDSVLIISTFISKSFYRKYSACIFVKEKMDVSLTASLDYEGNPHELVDVMRNDRNNFDNVVGSFGVIDRFTQLLSCKNVRVIDMTVPEKIQKKRIKKGKLPLSSYKVLEINIQGNRSVSSLNGGGWTNRVHLCRGHMAEYGSEFGKGLLFGKHSGRFWIPPHAKGDKRNGVIHKRYDVET